MITQPADYYAALNDLTVVQVSGEDANLFLSGQFTSDIANLSVNSGSPSAWCDPKGRVLYLLHVLCVADGYLCLLPSAALESFTKRLAMFVLRAKVEITQRSDMSVCGIASNMGEHSLAGSDDLIVLRLNTSGNRFLVTGETTKVEQFCRSLSLAKNADRWHAEDIINCYPSLLSADSGNYLPQNLNLDCLNAVSFSKGCYPGQEIIARLRYRGKVKQRLFYASLTISDSATNSAKDLAESLPGAQLFAPGDSEKKVATVLAAQAYEDNVFASVVVDMSYVDEHKQAQLAEHGTIFDRATFELIAPPYPLDLDTESQAS